MLKFLHEKDDVASCYPKFNSMGASAMQIVHKYFVDFLSKGHADLASEIFADDCEHIDQVWDPAHPTVGPEGMRHYLHDVRTAFPDFLCEIQEIATCK